MATTTDVNGNVYITGFFNTNTTSGGNPCVFGNVSLISNNMSSTFTVKYDSQGNVLWAKKISADGNSGGNDICTDSNGNVYVTGRFINTLFSGDIIVDAVGFSSGNDIYVVKYDANGNTIWGKSAGGSQSESGSSIAIDANGNLYITGATYSNSLDFGNGVTLNTPWASQQPQNPQYYTAKYGPSGTALWARGSSGSYNTYGNSVSVDLNNNIYVTGTYESDSVSFGTSTLYNSGSSGTEEIFLVKYNSSGNVIWARSMGGPGDDSYSKLDTDVEGNILISSGTSTSQTFTFGTNALTGPGIYLAKYDGSGNPLWSKVITLASHPDATNGSVGSISADADGNVYLTGGFYTPLNFNPLLLSQYMLNSDDNVSLFLAKFDNNGNFEWAIKRNPLYYGRDMAIDVFGNIYVAGSQWVYVFLGKIGFDLVTGTPTMEMSSEGGDSFVVYPNPTDGLLNFNFDESTPSPTAIVVSNTLGQVVMTDQLPAGQTGHTMNIAGLAPGMYVVRTENAHTSSTYKIIKQ